LLGTGRASARIPITDLDAGRDGHPNLTPYHATGLREGSHIFKGTGICCFLLGRT